MKKLPSRGNLPLKMKITYHNGEEHLSFRGSEMFADAARLISEWAISGEHSEELVPPDLVVVAKTKSKGKWCGWIPGSTNLDPDDTKAIYREMGETPADRRLIVLAQELEFYNLERDGDDRLKAVAVIGHYCGRASELRFFYGSLAEAVGLIHKVQSLRLGDDLTTRSVRKLLEITTPSKKQEKKPARETDLKESDDDARQRALIRAFEAQSMIRW